MINEIKRLIKKYDRVHLGFLPTRLQYMENLTELVQGPKIFIKRDDCTGLAFGGNKVRKLEFVMADALRKKAEVVITAGGLQSNWARQMAAATRKLGMEVILVLKGDEPQQYQGNLLLDKMLGCDIRFEKTIDIEGELRGEFPYTRRLAEEVRRSGKTPYLAALGAENPLGVLGYISALDELNDQLDKIGIEAHYIVLAERGGGTQAGIQIGVRLLGLKAEVLGIGVGGRSRTEECEKVSKLCNETLDYLQYKNHHFTPDEVLINMDYVGEGYAIPTQECVEAIKLVARKEAIILDPVYTGKAMAGLIDLIEKGRFKKGDNVIFIHTGGSIANFAYSQVF